MERPQVGDVVCWDRIWNKDANLYAEVTGIDDSIKMRVIVPSKVPGHHWKVGSPISSSRLGPRLGSGCSNHLLSVDDWPEEVCVFMAKRALMGEE